MIFLVQISFQLLKLKTCTRKRASMCVYIWLKIMMQYFFRYIHPDFVSPKKNVVGLASKKACVGWDLPSLKKRYNTSMKIDSPFIRQKTWPRRPRTDVQWLGLVTPPIIRYEVWPFARGIYPKLGDLRWPWWWTTYPSPGMIRLVANLQGSC